MATEALPQSLGGNLEDGGSYDAAAVARLQQGMTSAERDALYPTFEVVRIDTTDFEQSPEIPLPAGILPFGFRNMSVLGNTEAPVAAETLALDAMVPPHNTLKSRNGSVTGDDVETNSAID